MIQHYKKKIFECPCGFVFKYGQQMKMHIESAHKDDKTGKFHLKAREADPLLDLARKGNEGIKFEDPHTCFFCRKKFKNRKTLKTHLKGVHKKGQPLCCDLCGKKFIDKATITVHMKIHCDGYFTCDICDYKTILKQDLTRHQLTHGPKVKCNVCKKQVSNLKAHMFSHLPKEKCQICKKMVERSYFSDHKKRHEKNLVDMKCRKCGETFESYEKLRR